MKHTDLEYFPKTAARSATQAAQRRRVETQRPAVGAEPIQDQEELARQVQRLAGAWGLKRKKGRES